MNTMDTIKLFNGDCMEEMKNITKNSVNAIITDLRSEEHTSELQSQD